MSQSAQKLSRDFPSPGLGSIEKPAVVVDQNGINVLFYLPGIMPVALVVRHTILSWWHDLTVLQEQAEMAAKDLEQEAQKNVSANGPWRTNRANFQEHPGQSLSPGCIDMSPGYYAQGHVCTVLFMVWILAYIWSSRKI